MTHLLAELSAFARDAFAGCGLAPEWGVVQPADRPDLAQFQCNGALGAAKQAKTNPRAIAEQVSAELKENPIFAEVSIAGPGFINMKLTDTALEERLAALAADPKSMIPQSGEHKTLVIDFGGPNVAKPMHVGHLRSAIIGDCLQRLFRANGWQVTSDVHLGDWGLQMGQLITEVQLRQPELPYFDFKGAGPYPAASPVTMDDLEVLYPAASAACKADPKRLEAARQATADLQEGRPGYRALWKHFVKVSEEGLRREYGSLGIGFDLWKGESDADPYIGPMIQDLKERGVAEMSEGALVVPVAKPTDKKEIPPLLLLKTDGAVLYGTTDLATIVARVKEADPDLILYVVDQRQGTHFEQVFRAAELAKLNGKAQLEHIGYGTVNGADGKPFKTREGGVMKLYDLIAQATEMAAKRLAEQGLANDYDPKERESVAKAVGVAAIKFADLVNHRNSNYVFDLDRFLRFEGKTGPYLQYAAVRISSILRKAEGEGAMPAAPVIRSDEERKLALHLLLATEALCVAEDKRAPNVICDYVFTLAQEFSRFYTVHHIMSESDAALKAARLGLCRLTRETLETMLYLLGITVPDRM